MTFWVECLVTCLRVLWYRLWLLRPIIFIRSWKMFLKKFPFPFWTIWHKYGQRLTTNKWPDGQKMIKTKKGHWQHGQKKLSGQLFCPDKRAFTTKYDFAKVFATLTNKSISEASARIYCRPAPSDHQSQQNILMDSKKSFQAFVDTLKHTRWKQ